MIVPLGDFIMQEITLIESTQPTVLAIIIAIALGAVIFFIASYLVRGLYSARTLLRREFSAYFLSPIAYVLFVVFLAVTGYLFNRTFDLLTTAGPKGTEFPMQAMFANERFWLVFLFIPPILTMRLFAEERSAGTLEMLMTAPLLDWQVVLCKYLGCLAFYVVLWLPTLCYLPALLGWHAFELHAPSGLASFVFILGLIIFLAGIVLQFPINLEPFWRLSGLLMIVSGLVIGILGGMNHFQSEGPHLIDFQSEIDPFPVLSTYLGMFLAGAMFLSIGILVSSLVKDQMVSALIAMGLSLLFLVAGFWRPEQDGGLFYRTLYFFSVPLHFERSFTRGIFDTRPIILYVSTAFFCLFLTVRSLESRRWR